MTQFQNLTGFWRLWSGFCPFLWARSGKPLGFLPIAPILKDGSPQLLASPLCCLPQLLGQQSTQAVTIGTLEPLRGTCIVDDFHPTWGSPLGELQSPWRISSKWDLEIPCLSHSLQRQLWAVKRRKDWELGGLSFSPSSASNLVVRFSQTSCPLGSSVSTSRKCSFDSIISEAFLR